MSRMVALFALGAGLIAFAGDAHSTFISPTRIIIDANQTTGEMVIMNRQDETQIYTFVWQSRAMTPDGIITEEEEAEAQPGYKPAAPHLVYSPRQAIVGPGESQRIRFFVKRKGMTDGEYRSHILVSGRPVEDKEKPKFENLGGVVPIQARVGLPVMVRHGGTVAGIEAKSLKIIKEDGRNYLDYDIVNKGTRTLYARANAYCTRAGAAEPEHMELPTIRLYHEVVNLHKKIPFPKTANLDSCQSIRLDLTDPMDFEYSVKPFFSAQIK